MEQRTRNATSLGQSFQLSGSTLGSGDGSSTPANYNGNKQSENEQHVAKPRKPYVITKQRERWTPNEHTRFLEALQLFGRQWRKIEEYIGTKTAVQIRSHAQKFFTKVEKEGKCKGVNGRNGMTINIPPPRPKRKPSHPYPKKAKTPNNKNASAGNHASNKQKDNKKASMLRTSSAASFENCLMQGVKPGHKSDQIKIKKGNAENSGQHFPVEMYNGLNPYFAWMNALNMLSQNQGNGAFFRNVVTPTPHKIHPGLVPVAGHTYGSDELKHMQKLLMNAADCSVSKEQKDQILSAVKLVEQYSGDALDVMYHKDQIASAQLNVPLGSISTQSAFVSTQHVNPVQKATHKKFLSERNFLVDGNDSSGREGEDTGSGGSGSRGEMRNMAPKSPSPQEQSLKKGGSSGNGDSNGSDGNGITSNVKTHFDQKVRNGTTWNDNDQHPHSSGSDQSNEQTNNATSQNHAESHLMQLLPNMINPMERAKAYQHIFSMYAQQSNVGSMMWDPAKLSALNQNLAAITQMNLAKSAESHVEKQRVPESNVVNKTHKLENECKQGMASTNNIKKQAEEILRQNSGFLPYKKSL